ncbi:MAG: glutamate--tRNA ligase [Planctomycetota bacterium]
MAPDTVRVRFAPSPTGYLHVGNARTALFNYLYARSSGGSLIIRIEDTDAARSRPEFERALLEDLRWLGLDWDEGPDVGGPFEPYRQSERLEIYRRQLDKLLHEGKAYPCFCLPDELDARRKAALSQGRAPAYDGRCAGLSAEQIRSRERRGCPKSYRYRLPDTKVIIDDMVRGRVEFDTGLMGDTVIWKSDSFPTFHFSVTVDDALMDVTCVLRGEGHLPNAPVQSLLARDLGYQPPAFAHMSQTLAPDGGKISKRRGGMTLRDFREAGCLPEALLNYIALLGWSPRKRDEFLSLDEAIGLFRVRDLVKSPAYFDKAKFSYICRRHMQAADPQRLARLAAPFMESAGLPAGNEGALARTVAVVQGRAETVSQLPGLVRPYLVAPTYDTDALEALRAPGAAKVLAIVAEQLAQQAGVDEKNLRVAFEAAREATGLKGRALYVPVRVALTGSHKGPEITEIVTVFGGRETAGRLRAALRAAERSG